MISPGFRGSWKYNESLSATSKHPKDSRYIAMCLIVNVLQIITAAVFTVSCELLTNSRAATAANRGKRCRCGSGRWVESGKCAVWPVEVVASDAPCRNGSESREMVPLWEGAMGGMCSTRPVDVVASDAPCRNGSKLWEMLPLWKWEKGGKCPVRPVDVVASDTPYRNGSESREMVPLWKWVMGRKCAVWPVDIVASDTPYRNGSKSREMLPLWIGRRKRQAP